MEQSLDEIKRRYPLPVYSFKVEIDGETIAFSEVSGLDLSFDTITYMESKTTQPGPGPEIFHMPAQIKPVFLVLRKGYIRTKNLPVFYDWINSVQINLVEKKNLKILLTDEEGNAVVTWTVINAFPIRLEAPTFNAASNEVAIEALELMADRMVIEEN